MKLTLKDTNCSITLSKSVFQFPFKESLIHQVVVSYATNGRKGTRAQKSRSEVSGSNKKPWRQKGTGQARSGTKKSPIWRSGGVTFAAKPKKYHQKINKKMYCGAMKSIFSELIRKNRLTVLKKIKVKKPKTKLLLETLKKIKLNSALIIVYKIEKNLFLSSRNINQIHVTEPFCINPLLLIKFDNIVITVQAIRYIESTLK